MKKIYLLVITLIISASYTFGQKQINDVFPAIDRSRYSQSNKNVQLVTAVNEEYAWHLGIAYSYFIKDKTSLSLQFKYGDGGNYKGYNYNSLYTIASINYLIPVFKKLNFEIGVGTVLAIDDIKGRILEGEKAEYYPELSKGIQFKLGPEIELTNRFSLSLKA